MTQQERDEIRALVLSFSTKISDLPEVEALQDGDYVVVVQNDGSKKHSKKATLESLLELIKVYYPDHNGAKYQGVAHPSDTNVQVPVGTDGFWFAIDAGVYTNYGGITVTNAPKTLFYNATTHEWSSEELWGDINGTVGFRLITGTAENSLDTFKIPVIAGRDYIISALAKPTGTFATLNIYEYDYNGTLINTTGYHVPEHSFVPRPGVDYIKISLGYNPSNPIDASLSEVRISSSIRNLVEGITNFVVDVLQGDYETRIDNLENYVEGAIGSLTTNLGALTAKVESAEGNITDLQADALGIHADIRNVQEDILGLDVRADALELDMTNAQGDILDLDVRAGVISATLENAVGDIHELSVTAEGLEQRVTNAEGDVHTLQSTATTLESQITATDGRVSVIRQDVNEIDAKVINAQGDIAGLAIEAHRIDLYAQSINESLGDYETYANGIMRGLQDQLDGVVDTYFYDYMPVHEDATGAPDSQVPLIEITIEGVTVPCEPYASWYNTDHGGTAQEVNTERLKHLGDVFYDNKSGYAFRFSNTGTEENPVFAWVEIQDSAVIKALADAARAQDTADHKRRVFVYSVTYPTPYAPYDVGDLWVKPVTVGTGASAQNTTELYRCITARERTTDIFPFNPAVNTDTTSDYCDWEPADGKAEIVTKSNLQVLSDAIVGQTTQIVYNDDGTISSQSTASIQTTAGQIRLNVANGAIDTAVGPDGKITTPLLGTGIDIIHGDITLIANHISLKNQSDITGLELITIGESPNQKVVIDVGSLNVSGIFTTSAWDNSSLVNPGVKQQLLASAAGTAEQMLGTALYGSGGTQQQPTGGVYKALNPITTALTENTTVIAGGLMMSTALVLGGLTGPDDSQGNPTWEPWSGMFGVYDPTVGAGGGVAAWYGGTNVDAFTVPNWDTMTDVQKAAAWSQYRYARTLFRMDGSGYLANGEISWSDQGSLVIHGATLYDSQNNHISLDDIIELKSWFVKESYTDGQGNTRYAIKLATGTAAGTIAGFYTDGFISAGGLSSGGGASGTTLAAVWENLIANTGDGLDKKIHTAHLPTVVITGTNISGTGTYSESGGASSTLNLNLIATGSVSSVAGKTGDVTLYHTDIDDWSSATSSFLADNDIVPLADSIGILSTGLSGVENDLQNLRDIVATMSWADSRFLTGNQEITLSGDVSGTGTTSIEVAIGAGKVTNAMLAGSIENAKLSSLGKFTIGSTLMELGGTYTAIAGLTKITSSTFSAGGYTNGNNTTESTITYDSDNHAWKITGNLYATGFISAGGPSSGGGASGATLAQVWESLKTNTDLYAYEKINAYHIPIGTGLVVDTSGLYPVIKALGAVTSVVGQTGDVTAQQISTALSLGIAATYGVATSVNQTDTTRLVTGAAVWAAIDALPEPMIFKGSLGTGGTIQVLPTASSSNEGWVFKVITDGTYASQEAKIGDLFICANTGTNTWAWVWIPSGDEPSGTVTSVGLSVPTGLSVTGSPITSSGTLAITFASGYSIPLTADTTKGVTAYGWGNHADVGYLLASTAASTYATITALNGVSGRVTTLEERTNWDTYLGIDSDGNVYVKMNGDTARHFYSYGAVSAGGLSTGGGTTGIDLGAMWTSLTNSTVASADVSATTKINVSHLPALSYSGGVTAAYTSTGSGTTLATSLTISIPENTFAAYTHSHTTSQITDWSSATSQFLTAANIDPLTDAVGNLSTGLTGVITDLQLLNESAATKFWVSQVVFNIESEFPNFGTSLSADTNALSLLSKDGTALSVLNASDLVTVLGTAAVARATGDADGNTIKSSYGASLSAASNALSLVSKSGATLSTLTAADMVTIIGNNAVNRATADGDGNTISSTYLKLSGDTMTGALTLKANQYISGYGMNANNSDIVGVNSIYTEDLADDMGEGIHFFRSSGYWDSLTSSNGVLYYYPNRATGTTAFSGAYTVYHSGNSNKSDVSWACNNLTVSGNSVLSGELYVNYTNDVTASGGGSLIIGTKTSTNLAMDDNEIMARNNGAVSVLYLNAEGGNVIINETAGNTGFGVSSPVCKVDTSDKIHVGGTRLSTTSGNPSEFGSTIRGTFIYSNGIGFMDNYLGTSGNDSSWIRQIETASNDGYLEIATGDDGTESIYFRSYNTSNVVAKEFLKMDGSNGCIGINNTSPSYRLHVDGDIVATGAITAGATQSSSDARLKNNISDIQDSLGMLMSLRPRSWDWNELSNLEGHSIGLVAQEVMTVLPYAVGTVKDNKLGEHYVLNYSMLHAVEIGAIQNHENRIEALERENQELREELSRIKSARLRS